MGNHEYCPNCDENDFYRGYPCDPVKVARRIKMEQETEEMKQKAIERMKRTLEDAVRSMNTVMLSLAITIL